MENEALKQAIKETIIKHAGNFSVDEILDALSSVGNEMMDIVKQIAGGAKILSNYYLDCNGVAHKKEEAASGN